ncbi:cyclic nucleotide-binding domain-containing protein [Candidatus Peregrinibacteria bacterium]|jgi:CRP-like cAMP-binding protein|nr:cyclic nucleotide-binding domain-containing protein [Candidatus Peregrinibacteria bacterium]MBT4631416.1 cyclic nucleotide-binding domain-containing protein [Candidatus Peregrinibacteria bacterium]MBT5516925.1 cyclic nucleotide-binding domain-containing protein [Candidatus Peregrinibacteria bacterium]MBT5823999.1 cyclic nucleotide-binding domain-containing protein [Candidatus Peregrinibacteria bacterium]
MNLILNILRTVPLFHALSEAEHKSIIEHVNMEYFPAHHILFEQGVMGDSMYIIKTGVLRIFNETGELAQLGEGDFFGEMALIEDQPRMAAAETLSDCEIFVLKKEDFGELMSKSPEISEKVQAAYLDRKNKNNSQ